MQRTEIEKGHLRVKYSIKEAYNAIFRTGNDFLLYYHEQTLSRGQEREKCRDQGFVWMGEFINKNESHHLIEPSSVTQLTMCTINDISYVNKTKGAGVPSAESSRFVQGLGKGVSGKPYPRLCNARRPRLEPGTFRSQAVRLYRLHQARPSWLVLYNSQILFMGCIYCSLCK